MACPARPSNRPRRTEHRMGAAWEGVRGRTVASPAAGAGEEGGTDPRRLFSRTPPPREIDEFYKALEKK